MSAGIKYLGIPIHPIVDITYKTESEKNIINEEFLVFNDLKKPKIIIKYIIIE